MFVTRYPCLNPQDGGVLPVLCSRPPDMFTQDWHWLQSLPFGAIVFPGPKGNIPLPKTVVHGNLGGDLYLVLWDDDVLSGIREPTKPSSPLTKKAAVKVEETPHHSVSDWLSNAQQHMLDLGTQKI
mmetsp:Transcript_28545/g.66326  ORF Transcript_28545/g.66326 Transcript_28545/m.66326 type:complete len:126 (+) Transcript_28545:221-598(+)